jgi:MerR family mercuric resistance operon transcriptional regulator
MNAKKQFTIGCLAKELGICTETIRYYHRIGLLPIPKCHEGHSVRLYSDKDIQLLKFIKRAQRLGFSLEETRSLIELSNGRSCPLVQPIVKQKLAELEEKIAEMVSMRDLIAQLLKECDKNENGTDCPVIQALLAEHLPLSTRFSKTAGGVKHGQAPR